MNASEGASFKAQYDALHNGCGFIELAGWSSVTLTGVDRQKFLNNFCTNDITRLAPTSSCEAFFCNVKGRIIGHGLVTCRNDELVVIGAAGQAASLAAHLDRYVIREDVTVRDTTAERAYLLVAGRKDVRDRLADEFGNPPLFFPWKLIDADVAGVLEIPPVNIVTATAAFVSNGCIPCQPEVFDAARIEAGMPLFGVDFDEHNFPQEVGRDREAISFTKGCYLGQETVARIDALGHVNQRLVGVAFSGDEVPPAGTELSHDKANAGRVTSPTYSPALGRPLALAMVRREHNAVGTKLESAAGKCEVIALPASLRPAAS